MPTIMIQPQGSELIEVHLQRQVCCPSICQKCKPRTPPHKSMFTQSTVFNNMGWVNKVIQVRIVSNHLQINKLDKTPIQNSKNNYQSHEIHQQAKNSYPYVFSTKSTYMKPGNKSENVVSHQSLLQFH